MEMKGMDKMIGQLTARLAESIKNDNCSVVVGYTQNYALFVHENLEAHHKPGKQAKFLEQPARELSSSGELSSVVIDAKRRGATMAQALLVGALRIQRESQLLVPVDTGALKGSAFTRIDN